MKSLLLWIVPPTDLDSAIQNIREIWKPEGKITILKRRVEINPTEFFIIWNSEYNFRHRGVIKINRKGTTYFTIDAMNALSIQALGRIDKGFIPDWDNYRFRILLTNGEGEINEIATEIYEVVKLWG